MKRSCWKRSRHRTKIDICKSLKKRSYCMQSRANDYQLLMSRRLDALLVSEHLGHIVNILYLGYCVFPSNKPTDPSFFLLCSKIFVKKKGSVVKTKVQQFVTLEETFPACSGCCYCGGTYRVTIVCLVFQPSQQTAKFTHLLTRLRNNIFCAFLLHISKFINGYLWLKDPDGYTSENVVVSYIPEVNRWHFIFTKPQKTQTDKTAKYHTYVVWEFCQ